MKKHTFRIYVPLASELCTIHPASVTDKRVLLWVSSVLKPETKPKTKLYKNLRRCAIILTHRLRFFARTASTLAEWLRGQKPEGTPGIQYCSSAEGKLTDFTSAI